MAHIAGVELPRDKRVLIGLTYIYGIGRTTSREILSKVNIDENKKVKDLSLEEEKLIRELIQNDYIVEGELRTQTAMDIKRLMEIDCYRGQRHKKNMPVRGQRTHTNAKTRRGRRKGSGAGKRK
ncbi:MAG: 30S ribosomal protein S13 [Candidatus Cloacimonetes bacterium]|nr:30S ribosomal protein S13 [Candidatus Cloacimonadota bacterium]MCF7814336.1 30S ribosomal protein S13 [Candidatus Cloacimonadota bacterium]MCF7868972.1 30S ribosomal protein S13 [Candidatus Cloacimonadota bacterium]MCF7884366.1 30S ribosomal protein S13 [Candidatus Cloacimonadota bacterium]